MFKVQNTFRHVRSMDDDLDMKWKYAKNVLQINYRE